VAFYAGAYKIRGIKDEERRGYNQTFAFFGQDEFTPLDNLVITAGLRYTHNQNNSTKNLVYPDRVKSVTESNVVGSLGVVFTGIENLSLRALFSQGFRTPTLNEQLMGATQRTLPNPNLKPEKSNNYEIGARYSAHNLNIDLALFYSTLNKAFYSEETNIPNPNQGYYTRPENAAKAVSYGAELSASYEIPRLYLTPYVNLTSMTYEREYRNGFKTKHAGVPRYWGTGGLRFAKDVGDNFRFFSDASATWSDGYYDEPSTGFGPTTRVFGRGFKGDLTIGLEGGEERQYRGSLTLRNLGDNEYEPYGFFQPGFHIVTTLEVEF
jgi:hemoglobin/transferrin/lactoferrin receptor protein